MDTKELRLKTPTELDRLIAELRGQLHHGAHRVVTRQETKVRTLRAVRKDLARALTVRAESAKKTA
jgi:ribosomal protein L29